MRALLSRAAAAGDASAQAALLHEISAADFSGAYADAAERDAAAAATLAALTAHARAGGLLNAPHAAGAAASASATA